VIFMTDGRPTVGATDVKEIIGHVKANNARQARIFTFGVGFEVNTTLLDQVAREHGGESDYVRPQEDIEVKVSALYNKIAYPVMTGIQVDWGQARVFDVYPRKAPDLFRGGQVVLMGRSRGELPDEIKVAGVLAGEAVGLAFEAEDEDDAREGSKAHDFIPRLWATRKVGYLLEEIRQRGEDPELKQEVIRLARQYGLVTPYTSYLAVDDSELEQRPPAPPIARPWGGPSDDARRGDLGGSGGGRMSPNAAPAPAEPMSEEAEVVGGFSRGAKAAEKKKREQVLRERQSFDKDTGEGAVETSIAVDAFKNAEVGDEAGGIKTRFVQGTLFVLKEGAWRQDGVEGAAEVKIRAFSPAYFRLLEAHPGLKARLAVGRRVILKVGKKIVEVGPDGQDELPLEQIKKW
jgi:Ca-activated chloride channel family protein